MRPFSSTRSTTAFSPCPLRSDLCALCVTFFSFLFRVGTHRARQSGRDGTFNQILALLPLSVVDAKENSRPDAPPCYPSTLSPCPLCSDLCDLCVTFSFFFRSAVMNT